MNCCRWGLTDRTSLLCRPFLRNVVSPHRLTTSKSTVTWKRPIIFAFPGIMKLCSAPMRTTIEHSTALLWHYTKPTQQGWPKQLCQLTATCLSRHPSQRNSCTISDWCTVIISTGNIIVAGGSENVFASLWKSLVITTFSPPSVTFCVTLHIMV